MQLLVTSLMPINLRTRYSALFALPLLTGTVNAQLASANGVYNTSHTPNSLPWNTYNYCNAPHVNKAHYVRPAAKDAELVYLNVMIRHHKRTPDNLIPNENSFNPISGWDCTDFIQENHGNSDLSARVHHVALNPPQHPFRSMIWNGSCDEGQLTREGLEDAVQHGKDFASVYRSFLGKINPETIYLRTSTEDRTYQVAGGMLFGMDPSTAEIQWPGHVEPATIDSIVPSYPCPAADAIRDAYQSVPAWTDHLNANQALQDRLNGILGTAGREDWNSWYDHSFDVFTSRTCHAHPLPCNATTGECVSIEDAATIFSLGDFEYNYIWNTAVNSTTYNQLTFGVMFSELSANFKSFSALSEPYKLRLYVGHDGSMIRLASGLGLGKQSSDGRLRWPALGSEIVFEVWKTSGRSGKLFVRVMHEGTPVKGLEWVALDDMISLLDQNVPDNLFEKCMG